MSELKNAALYYAGLGWKVFPLKPNAKTPLTAHGVKDATTDAAQIEAWWTQCPNANIGFACGGENGIHVIDADVDIAKGIDSWKTINDLLASGKTFPRTVCQNTPRGGAHFFYRSNLNPKNKNSFMHGVDIRSEGYYVLLPPSIHPNGRMYGWADRMSPWEHKLAEYPDFMRPAERTPRSTQTPCSAPTQQPISSIDPPDINVIERAKRYLATCDAAVQGQAGHDKLLWATVVNANDCPAIAPESQRHDTLETISRQRYSRAGEPLCPGGRQFYRLRSNVCRIAFTVGSGGRDWHLHANRAEVRLARAGRDMDGDHR